MTTSPGRAGLDVAHDRSSSAQRSNRARLLEEAARHAEEEWIAAQARANPNVDPSRTHENEMWVNDGAGGFKLSTDINEALDYGDERLAKVGRKISEKNWTLTRIVIHAPESLLEKRSWVDAKGKTRTYYAAKDPEEVKRYFEAATDQVTRILPGGQAAMHTVVSNYDEHKPHLQIMADTFMPDPGPKGELGNLVNGFSDVWGQSRRQLDKDGKSTTGKVKLRKYQADFRHRMVEEGFPVEWDADPIRAKRKLSKADYVTVKEMEEAAAQRVAELEADKARHEQQVKRDRERLAVEHGRVKALRREAEQEQEAAKQALDNARAMQEALDKQRAELNRERAALADIEEGLTSGVQHNANMASELSEMIEELGPALDAVRRQRVQAAVEQQQEQQRQPFGPSATKKPSTEGPSAGGSRY